MRPWLALPLVLLLAACTVRAQSTVQEGPIRVNGQALPFDAADPKASRAGDFVYAGGLYLTSPDTSLFGGLSDLKVLGDGRFVSESDEGALLRARLRLDAAGRLNGVDDAVFGLLKGVDGKPLDGKHEADAEGVAVWPNGDLMVSFERHHRIWLYPHGGGAPRSLPMPAVSMPENQGMEGLALAPSQGPDAYWVGVEGGSIWLCHVQAACVQWTGMPGPGLGYRLTALAETPAGDLVILHHSWNPFTRQSHVVATVVGIPRKPDQAPVKKWELKLGPPQTVDNLEGVAAVTGPKGGLRLYLVSDDNFSPDQRTLLLAFDLAAAK